MARLCYGFFIVFLLKFKSGECEESSEEAAQKEVLGGEYEQIFNSIPTLFEYILEMLEERPEILEKDDITFFQEMPQESCEGEVKREIMKCDDHSALDEDCARAFKRNIITNYVQSEIATELPKTATSTHSELITRGVEDVNNIIGHTKPRNNDVKKKVASKLNFQMNKSNSQIHGKSGIKDKRNFKQFGDRFLGLIDWTKFYLSPEEVEEQAIKIEQAIEDHNKNKQR